MSRHSEGTPPSRQLSSWYSPSSSVLFLTDMLEELPITRLADTPRRVAQTYVDVFAGVELDERAPLRKGGPVPEGVDFVALRGLEFRSTCAHHLLPFSVSVHIAYVPGDWLVGIGSIGRSRQILSTRPQLQEELAPAARQCNSGKR